MDNWLNYHHLYYFRTIANEGSIAKASKKLRLGQPTLSAQLKQLEFNIGVKLFDRQHKRLVLTESGKMALEYANEVFRLGQEMVEMLNDRLVPLRPHLQIGAQDQIPKRIIADMVHAAGEIGSCTVSVVEGRPDELMRELTAHRIDLLLLNLVPHPADAKRVITRSLARLDVSICGAPRFRRLKKGFPRSLSQQPFVMPTYDSRLRADLEHMFRLTGIQPDIVAETQDTALQKILGTSGMGLIPIARKAVSGLVKDGQLVELGVLENVHEELFLISGSRRIENPISSRLFKTFRI